MSDWKVGDLVQVGDWQVLFRIKAATRSLPNCWNLEVVWRSPSFPNIGQLHSAGEDILETPNEMTVLALVANGDLDL